ncbi:hypothetical protein TNCV_3423361 [Trichonephila clavipes]|nr:hypothetical protein TNCV_3423361 [Trichonephila clavipes]
MPHFNKSISWRGVADSGIARYPKSLELKKMRSPTMVGFYQEKSRQDREGENSGVSRSQRIRPSGNCRQNRDSSEKTAFTRSCTQFYRLAHQSRLYATLSNEVEAMATVLTVLAAGNFTAPYEQILSKLQTCPFPD